MDGTEFDIVVVGSAPFARLLAGWLARDHGKRVALIGRQASPQRLPRSLDMALGTATRPETWKMLRSGAAETQRLLAATGLADALGHTDVAVSGDTAATAVALDHLAHLAMGLGMAGRSEGQLHVFGSIAMLRPEAEPKLYAWLGTTGVTHIDSDAASLAFLRSGLAELTVSGEKLVAGQLVVADDGALLDSVPEAERPEQLRVVPMTATLTAPVRRLAAPVIHFPDRGVTLLQRAGDGVLALIAGDADVEARLASVLPGPFPLKRLATSRFRRIVSRDGAPLIGRLKPSRLFIAAGLGDAAAFFAPAVARLLAGTPTDDEKRWFAARDPARPSRELVAEIVP